MFKRAAKRGRRSVAKATGADIELGNFMLGRVSNESGGKGFITGFPAQALLREIEGIAQSRAQGYGTWSGGGYGQVSYGYPTANAGYEGTWGTCGNVSQDDRTNPLDWGRKFLLNGGCFYIDSSHLEGCLPESLSARHHVACRHGMIRLAQDALAKANKKLGSGEKIVLNANNSDGHGNSWGSHLNVMVSRTLFDNIFDRKLHYLLWLASFQISSVIYSGAGKVGRETDRSNDGLELSQRAEFFSRLVSLGTMFDRGVVNSRDEAHCSWAAGSRGKDTDGSRDLARLHIIFFDHCLAEMATFVTVGATQLVLAMLEQGRMDPKLILEDPIESLWKFSSDPSLTATARVMSGREYSALEIQEAIHGMAANFVEKGLAQEWVPEAEAIVAEWGKMLQLLREKAWVKLAQRLDWALRYVILQEAMGDGRFNWRSPEIRYLSSMYSSLDEEEGLFWAYRRGMERVVTDGDIMRMTVEPPDTTRAWLRAQVLKHVAPEDVVFVDWERMEVKVRNGQKTYWPYDVLNVDLSDPTKHSKEDCEGWDEEATVRDNLTRMGALRGEAKDALPTVGSTCHALVKAGDPGDLPCIVEESLT